MAKKTQKPVEPIKPEDAKQLRADRDDALGYSREQFTFDAKKKKPAKKKAARKKHRPS